MTEFASLLVSDSSAALSKFLETIKSGDAKEAVAMWREVLMNKTVRDAWKEPPLVDVVGPAVRELFSNKEAAKIFFALQSSSSREVEPSDELL